MAQKGVLQKKGPSYTGLLWKVLRLAVPVEPYMSPLIIYYLDCERLYYSIPNDMGPHSNWKAWKVFRVRSMIHLTGFRENSASCYTLVLSTT